MPHGYKIRLADGSVIQLDRGELQSWRQRGLVGDRDLVQPPGSRNWVPLGDALASNPAASSPRATPGGALVREPVPWGRWVGFATTALAVSALATAAWWTYPKWRPLLPGHRAAPAPEASEAAPPLDPLARAIAAAVQESPHLTPKAAQALIASSAAGMLDPPETFRRAYFQASRGLTSLTSREANEFGALNSALYAGLAGADRVRLGTYLERVRAQRPTTPQEDVAMCRLVRSGMLRLSGQRRDRLRLLFERAILAGLAKAPAL